MPPSWIFKIAKFYWLFRYRAWRCISKPNFVKICQSVAKLLTFFDFSWWRPSPSWIFEIVNYYLLISRGLRRITVPNFVKIGPSIAEMLLFFQFSRWPPPPSWIFKIAKFYWLLGSRGWRRISTPNFVKISQSVAKILRFFDFLRWRPSPSWIFEIENFYLLSVSGGIRCITVPNFVKICRFVAEILRFFEFSRCRPSAILDSFEAYLVTIDSVVFIIWTFQFLARLAGKCLFTPQKLGFLAIWSFKWAAISTEAKKGTCLRKSVSFEPLSVIMWSAVWPVGALLKKGGINKKRNIVNISPICPKAPHGRIST